MTGVESGLVISPIQSISPRWKPKEHKNGSVCKTAADASKPEAFLAGVEITKPLQQTGRFRVSFREIARPQAVRPSFSSEEENTARIQTNRNHWSWLAHVSTFRRNDARGDERTLTHHPRLLAAQQPSRHEEVTQATSKTKRLAQRQIGRSYSADGYFAEDKP